MIDTHLHLIEADRFDYPWLADAPQLTTGHGLADWRPLADRAGVEGSVFMEVDVAEADLAGEAAHFCALAEDPQNGLLGVIAACRPEHDDFAEQLARLAHPQLRGLRRVLHVVDDDVSRSPLLHRNVALLAERDLSFDLCLRADQLALGLVIAEAAPDTRLVLDHCGNPPLADDKAMERWRDDVSRLAELPHVAGKVSGLVNHVPAGADALSALRPVIDHVAARFGWDRLMFGGDWPVSRLANHDLPDWATLARALVADRPDDAREAFFRGNAQRIYRLPSTIA